MIVFMVPLAILNLINKPLRRSLEVTGNILSILLILTIPAWGMAHVIIGR
jgi:hypothetical protein